MSVGVPDQRVQHQIPGKLSHVLVASPFAYFHDGLPNPLEGMVSRLASLGPVITHDPPSDDFITVDQHFSRSLDIEATLLQSGYRGRISDAADFALKNRVLLLESPQNIPIDISLAGFPFEALAVDRSSLFEFEPGCNLRTCSAEDLIVQKLFASRPRDLFDVGTIVDKQHGCIDWAYVETQLGPLAELKEQPDIMVHLAKLRTARE